MFTHREQRKTRPSAFLLHPNVLYGTEQDVKAVANRHPGTYAISLVNNGRRASLGRYTVASRSGSGSSGGSQASAFNPLTTPTGSTDLPSPPSSNMSKPLPRGATGILAYLSSANPNDTLAAFALLSAAHAYNYEHPRYVSLQSSGPYPPPPFDAAALEAEPHQDRLPTEAQALHYAFPRLSFMEAAKLQHAILDAPEYTSMRTLTSAPLDPNPDAPDLHLFGAIVLFPYIHVAMATRLMAVLRALDFTPATIPSPEYINEICGNMRRAIQRACPWPPSPPGTLQAPGSPLANTATPAAAAPVSSTAADAQNPAATMPLWPTPSQDNDDFFDDPANQAEFERFCAEGEAVRAADAQQADRSMALVRAHASAFAVHNDNSLFDDSPYDGHRRAAPPPPAGAPAPAHLAAFVLAGAPGLYGLPFEAPDPPLVSAPDDSDMPELVSASSEELQVVPDMYRSNDIHAAVTRSPSPPQQKNAAVPPRLPPQPPARPAAMVPVCGQGHPGTCNVDVCVTGTDPPNLSGRKISFVVPYTTVPAVLGAIGEDTAASLIAGFPVSLPYRSCSGSMVGTAQLCLTTDIVSAPDSPVLRKFVALHVQNLDPMLAHLCLEQLGATVWLQLQFSPGGITIHTFAFGSQASTSSAAGALALPHLCAGEFHPPPQRATFNVHRREWFGPHTALCAPSISVTSSMDTDDSDSGASQRATPEPHTLPSPSPDLQLAAMGLAVAPPPPTPTITEECMAMWEAIARNTANTAHNSAAAANDIRWITHALYAWHDDLKRRRLF